jgi:hypothetical protein
MVWFKMQAATAGTENLGTQPGCNRVIAALFAEEIIRLVGRKRTDRVFLVGCEHIELLVQLANHGFTNVTCGAALAGPSAGELTADIFVVPDIYREPEFTAALARLARYMGPSGVLLLGADASPFKTQLRQIQQVLLQRGFVFVHKHLDPVEVHLFCCRKRGAAQSRAA